MNIIYIGHYRDAKSGYGVAATDYILAMDSVGINVKPTAFKLGSPKNPPDRIVQLEGNQYDEYHAVIQHTLPVYFVKDSRAGKNIGMYTIEADSMPREWVISSNLMDEIWTFSTFAKESMERAGVEVPIKVVPHAIDTSKFKRSFKKSSLRLDFPDDFLFYAIGELHERKDFRSLLTAFYTEFAPHEPVNLVIKTGLDGLNPQQVMERFKLLDDEVKAKLRLYPNTSDYKSIILISDQITEDQLYSLHNDCDCYVSTSHGEGWNLPATDSLGFGKKAILPDHSSFKEYTWIGNSYLYKVYKTPCYGAETLPGLNTSRENWYQVNTLDLRSKMRWAYQERNNTSRIYEAKQTVTKYSYEVIGKLIKSLL
jgi:glycosyltransferase involved in cell wall biosynthesis